MHSVALQCKWIVHTIGLKSKYSQSKSLYQLWFDLAQAMKSAQIFGSVFVEYYWFHFRVAKCQRSNNNAAQWRCHECFGALLLHFSFFFHYVLLLLFGIGLGLHDPSLSLKLNIYCRMDIIGTSQPKGALVIKVYTVYGMYCTKWNESDVFYVDNIHWSWKMRFVLCVDANADENGVQETNFFSLDSDANSLAFEYLRAFHRFEYDTKHRVIHHLMMLKFLERCDDSASRTRFSSKCEFRFPNIKGKKIKHHFMDCLVSK